MNSLKSHVDSLFSKYNANSKIMELRDEILSNLEAKVTDLISNGMNCDEATDKVIKSMKSIDYLIDGNRNVYINKFKFEYLQIVLLYSIIAWIITIPFKIIGEGIFLNKMLLISSIIVGIFYLILYTKKESEYLQRKSYLNLNFAFRIKKIAWVLWLIFIVVFTLNTTAICFGSNIWFARPVNISGPYQFAELGGKYILPLISILFPLFINVAPKLILKYEAGEDNEDKK